MRIAALLCALVVLVPSGALVILHCWAKNTISNLLALRDAMRTPPAGEINAISGHIDAWIADEQVATLTRSAARDWLPISHEPPTADDPTGPLMKLSLCIYESSVKVAALAQANNTFRTVANGFENLSRVDMTIMSMALIEHAVEAVFNDMAADEAANLVGAMARRTGRDVFQSVLVTVSKEVAQRGSESEQFIKLVSDFAAAHQQTVPGLLQFMANHEQAAIFAERLSAALLNIPSPGQDIATGSVAQAVAAITNVEHFLNQFGDQIGTATAHAFIEQHADIVSLVASHAHDASITYAADAAYLGLDTTAAASADSVFIATGDAAAGAAGDAATNAATALLPGFPLILLLRRSWREMIVVSRGDQGMLSAAGHVTVDVSAFWLGAAIGSMMLPGLGTALGGVFGLLLAGQLKRLDEFLALKAIRESQSALKSLSARMSAVVVPEAQQRIDVVAQAYLGHLDEIKIPMLDAALATKGRKPLRRLRDMSWDGLQRAERDVAAAKRVIGLSRLLCPFVSRDGMSETLAEVCVVLDATTQAFPRHSMLAAQPVRALTLLAHQTVVPVPAKRQGPYWRRWVARWRALERALLPVHDTTVTGLGEVINTFFAGANDIGEIIEDTQARYGLELWRAIMTVIWSLIRYDSSLLKSDKTPRQVRQSYVLVHSTLLPHYKQLRSMLLLKRRETHTRQRSPSQSASVGTIDAEMFDILRQVNRMIERALFHLDRDAKRLSKTRILARRQSNEDRVRVIEHTVVFLQQALLNNLSLLRSVLREADATPARSGSPPTHAQEIQSCAKLIDAHWRQIMPQWRAHLEDWKRRDRELLDAGKPAIYLAMIGDLEAFIADFEKEIETETTG